MYTALIKAIIFPKEEMIFLNYWIKDINKII